MRVIPRDLFNDANLLKCLGKLYIALEQVGEEHRLTNDGEAFNIAMDVSDGSTSCTNVRYTDAHGNDVPLFRPMNSRETLPLYCLSQDGDEIEVFNQEYETLSPEFMNNWLSN